MVTVPVDERPDELERKFPRVFPVSAVTRAMAAKEGQKTWDGDAVVDLSKSFLADSIGSPASTTSVPCAPPASTVGRHCGSWNSKSRVSRKKLVAEQRRDGSLSSLLAAVVSGEEADKIRTGYVLSNGVLNGHRVPRPQLATGTS